MGFVMGMRTFLKVFACTAVAAWIGAAGVADGATVNVSAIVDATSMTGYSETLLGSPVRVYNGDTVVFDIDFTGNQTLTWGSNGQFVPWIMWSATDPYAGGDFTVSNVSVSFTDLSQGTQLLASQTPNQTSGMAHLGVYYNINDNVVRTFSGFKVSMVATFVDGVPYREYNKLWSIPTFGGTTSIGADTTAAVAPLPGVAVAGVTLLGGLGIGKRFRRRIAA
jgi:hypothetical protein